jgi:hypothetical protein
MGSDESATEVSCDEPENSTYQGPNLLGAWTSTFASNYYDSICNVDDFNQSSESWLGGVMNVDGSAPINLYMYFDIEQEDDTEVFYGAVDKNGGVSFSGTHAHLAGTVYAQFGGLAYHDALQDQDVIVGSAFLGMDVAAGGEPDGEIDCYARGSWTARKSGN